MTYEQGVEDERARVIALFDEYEITELRGGSSCLSRAVRLLIVRGRVCSIRRVRCRLIGAISVGVMLVGLWLRRITKNVAQSERR